MEISREDMGDTLGNYLELTEKVETRKKKESLYNTAHSNLADMRVVTKNLSAQEGTKRRLQESW